ncbi:helix-turn-helix domain-containing protein [Bradyrhizobium sp. CCGUVB1N3]|uniref:helix-turn-helix transcriptional regulator n=1 Tax=Bradyrhizobium sp. CCGUVB1N3 TaxID=2949629 RepID=UPI0020B31D70|nr:helix-turn-helix transcriptional regulator [Bradyrhizobium sp. CCGUVB1N3]MCP3475066.1 helix-turn-helix domain-containing protein [Bradyrhizobium sp. CCGUVB1N3]
MAQVPLGAHQVMDHRLISYVRPLRRRWGLTQAEFAFLIGTKTDAAVSRIEAVKTYPSLAQAIACSIIFDTPPLELFPELYGKVYEFVLKQAEELYETLQGDPSTKTRAKLDLLEDVLARAHPLIRDTSSV